MTFSQENTKSTHANIGSIKATFTETEQENYDVFLEISSHKFFINCKKGIDSFDMFEVISAKGFLELSKESLVMLRTLTFHLRNKMKIKSTK